MSLDHHFQRIGTAEVIPGRDHVVELLGIANLLQEIKKKFLTCKKVQIGEMEDLRHSVMTAQHGR